MTAVLRNKKKRLTDESLYELVEGKKVAAVVLDLLVAGRGVVCADEDFAAAN